MRLIDSDALWEAINGDKRGKEIAQMRSGKVLQTLTLVLEHIHTAPTIDAVPVVRCKDCQWFKPAHFKADDGTEHPWDGSFFLGQRNDGIYIGAKCKHERNTAYGEKDMAFRKPTDFCSYGERKE